MALLCYPFSGTPVTLGNPSLKRTNHLGYTGRPAEGLKKTSCRPRDTLKTLTSLSGKWATFLYLRVFITA